MFLIKISLNEPVYKHFIPQINSRTILNADVILLGVGYVGEEHKAEKEQQ